MAPISRGQNGEAWSRGRPQGRIRSRSRRRSLMFFPDRPARQNAVIADSGDGRAASITVRCARPTIQATSVCRELSRVAPCERRRATRRSRPPMRPTSRHAGRRHCLQQDRPARQEQRRCARARRAGAARRLAARRTRRRPRYVNSGWRTCRGGVEHGRDSSIGGSAKGRSRSSTSSAGRVGRAVVKQPHARLPTGSSRFVKAERPGSRS
jgi:hypothetical protein